MGDMKGTTYGKKTIIHVEKIPYNSPQALRSGKQFGDSAGTGISKMLALSQSLQVMADIANTSSSKIPPVTKPVMPVCSSPSDTMPIDTKFEVLDAELSMIEEVVTSENEEKMQGRYKGSVSDQVVEEHDQNGILGNNKESDHVVDKTPGQKITERDGMWKGNESQLLDSMIGSVVPYTVNQNDKEVLLHSMGE